MSGARAARAGRRQTLKTKTAQSLKATGGKGAAAALYKPKEKLIMAEIKAKVGELKQVPLPPRRAASPPASVLSAPPGRKYAFGQSLKRVFGDGVSGDGGGTCDGGGGACGGGGGGGTFDGFGGGSWRSRTRARSLRPSRTRGSPSPASPASRASPTSSPCSRR